MNPSLLGINMQGLLTIRTVLPAYSVRTLWSASQRKPPSLSLSFHTCLRPRALLLHLAQLISICCCRTFGGCRHDLRGCDNLWSSGPLTASRYNLCCQLGSTLSVEGHNLKHTYTFYDLCHKVPRAFELQNLKTSLTWKCYDPRQLYIMEMCSRSTFSMDFKHLGSMFSAYRRGKK